MQVNITKRIDTPEGKRYCPVVVGPKLHAVCSPYHSTLYGFFLAIA